MSNVIIYLIRCESVGCQGEGGHITALLLCKCASDIIGGLVRENDAVFKFYEYPAFIYDSQLDLGATNNIVKVPFRLHVAFSQ